MGRIDWARQSGDDFEAAVAICLCMENRKATRLRPSKGDKGIDILVPDLDGWIVYQLKSFTRKFTSSQRTQIKKSWESLNRYISTNKIKLKEWYLVTPESPTTERLEWLAKEVVGKVDFPTVWKGQDFVDGLASRHPEVIDYYFRDGKDRLESTVKEFLSLLSSGSDGASLDAAGSIERLQALHSMINKFDPHYYFDVAVGANREGSKDLTLQDVSDCLIAVETVSIDHRVIVKIYPKVHDALEYRPLPGLLTVRMPSDSEEAAKFKDFLEFGAPFQSSMGVASMKMDLPGGLGGEFEGGSFAVAPSVDARPLRPLQLDLYDPTEKSLATVILDMEPPTTGLDGSGSRIAGRDRGGAFRFEMRNRSGDTRVSTVIRSLEFTGKRPSELLAGVEFLANFVPPNLFEGRIEGGPVLISRKQIDQPLSEADYAHDVNIVIRALAEIQKNTVEDVRVPDLSDLSYDQADGWVRAARLLSGDQLVVTFDRLRTCLHGDGEKTLPEGQQIAVQLPFIVDIAGMSIDFGAKLLHISEVAAIREDELMEHEDHLDAYLVPVDGAVATLRWLK